MPAVRKRVKDGKLLPCVVKLNPVLSAFIYRETRARHYSDETELVNQIVREWAAGLEKVDVPALVKELEGADAEDEKEGAGEASNG